MASELVTCERTLQFEAGPEDYTFQSCDRHRPKLEAGDVMCFFGRASEPVTPVVDDPEDPEFQCYFCRGEDGP